MVQDLTSTFYIDSSRYHLRTIATPEPYQTETLPHPMWTWYGDGPYLVLVICGDGMAKVKRNLDKRLFLSSQKGYEKERRRFLPLSHRRAMEAAANILTN